MNQSERNKRIVEAAMRLTDGNQELAMRWLDTPLEIFGNRSPFEHAITDAGFQDVEALVLRLEHGVFS